MSNNLQIKSYDQTIETLLKDSESFLEKGYLTDRKSFEIVTASDEVCSLSFAAGIRLLHITKFTFDEKESILNKLSNVFTALYGTNTTIFMILKSDGEKCRFYLGVKDEVAISKSYLTLKASLNGNFPGIEYDDDIDVDSIENLMENVINSKVLEVSTVIGIPTLKSENKDNFLQGIEKVIDGMIGKAFSAIFIADPVDYRTIKDIKTGYENMYDQLYPFINLNVSLTKGEAVTLSKNLGESFTKSYSENLNRTDSINNSYTKGRSQGSTITKSVYAGGQFGVMAGVGLSKGETSTTSSSETIGRGITEGYGETFGRASTIQESIGESLTENNSKTIQINQKNKLFENISKKIEKHLERIECAEGNGFWNVGTYFLSEEPQNSIIAANIYNGITRGQISGLEKSSVCTFSTKNELENIKDYLYNFTNPLLKVNIQNNNIFTSLGSLVTNDELSLKLNLPQKSVVGLEVVKMASFGRNKEYIERNKSIKIGSLYHLGKTYSTKMTLNIESLSSHTFITGSTGSGKSNAIYCILEELYKKGIKFLVIEPAKGEYKNVFGGREDVFVYGTNSNYTELLKINPFSFKENIHILEHIDRLTEIFNACWPMYAAMPAILKEAVERAYISLGWDLVNSKNLYGVRKFPTLKDLILALNEVINKTAYSQEFKSNYVGALVTRVSSLNNGLIGNIFVENELTEEEVFEKNVIIDISRIPSMETKSLIMGILFMKLHEYRMSKTNVENSNLQHVTVLEEAHNLLKRTSTEQSLEEANFQGKSVEMLTNAIAEMRTYGQGFIIADQAPEMLDSAVIRNTNTKICLRLPNLKDREIVGKSMNLDEAQINELAKLDTGVAAVIQTNWNESCLVKFDQMLNKTPYNYIKKEENPEIIKDTIKYIINSKLKEKEKIEVKLKAKVQKKLDEEKINLELMSDKEMDLYIYNLIGGDRIADVILSIPIEDMKLWNTKVLNILNNLLNMELEDEKFKIDVINSIVRGNVLRDQENMKLYIEWDKFKKNIL